MSTVTFEQVAQFIDAHLESHDDVPPLNLIREVLGGSQSTIHKHRKQYLEQQVNIKLAPSALPDDVLTVLRAAFGRYKNEVKDVLTKTQQETEQELDAAIQNIEALTQKVYDLEEKLRIAHDQAENLKGNYDALKDRIEEYRIEQDTLQNEANEQKSRAEESRIDAAKSKLKFEAAEQGFASIKEDNARLREEISKAKASETSLEKSLAVEQQKTTDLNESNKELKSRIEAQEKTIDQYKKEYNDKNIAQQKALQSHLSAENKALELQESLTQYKKDNKTLLEELYEFKIKHAVLEDKFNSLKMDSLNS